MRERREGGGRGREHTTGMSLRFAHECESPTSKGTCLLRFHNGIEDNERKNNRKESNTHRREERRTGHAQLPVPTHAS
jgi:hypothetical protein